MTTVTNNDADLLGIIEREFYTFDVLQLVAVIEELLEDGWGGGVKGRATGTVAPTVTYGRTVGATVPGRPIFFEVDAGLSFPPADVGYVCIGTDNNDPIGGAPAATVRLPVMNLLGASSPLPINFSDHITRGRRDADMYADFLSVLQNRLHALWLDAQRKYSLWGGGGGVAEKIFASMTGLPADKAGFLESALAGLWHLSNRTRSAQGLKELLYAAFGDVPIQIDENLGRYAAVSNARPLGGAARLGRNAAVGTRVYDKTAKFRITLGPLCFNTYKTFMPNESNYLLINEIVSVYLNEPVICEILITCKLSDLPKARLGGNGKIGQTAALGTNGNGVAAFMVM